MLNLILWILLFLFTTYTAWNGWEIEYKIGDKVHFRYG